MKSKKQVVVEFLNNDNTKTEWTIAILEEGTIIVFENDSQTENTKSSLRYIAEYIGFSYDKSWTTRQFGSKLIDYIHSLQEQDVKKSNNKEELHKSVRVRIEVDIAEHNYVVFNCDEDMSDSYAFNGDDGPNEIRIYLNGEKIDYDDDVIDEVMGNATESPYQTFDLGKKWEDFEYITKFGYWDNISTIVWVFDVEDFDINKLTFHYECFDAIFELADYNAEEHCINLLYDGKKIEVSDSGSSDGDFEECWNLDDDDDYQEDEDELNDYIYAHSVKIDDEEAEMIFEALAEIVLIDGVLSSDEVDNLMSMATALGIDDSRAILMLVDMAKEEEDIVIEF